MHRNAILNISYFYHNRKKLDCNMYKHVYCTWRADHLDYRSRSSISRRAQKNIHLRHSLLK